MSKNLTKAMQPFCVSVACGKDAVPRATTANLSRLVEEMMVALARCRCRNPPPPRQSYNLTYMAPPTLLEDVEVASHDICWHDNLGSRCGDH